jgi:hypothetical protein
MNDREFSDIEIFERSRKGISLLCSYYVIITYASLTRERLRGGDISTPQEFIFQQFAYFLKS